MVIEPNIIPGVKARTETIARDVTILRSTVLDVRVGDMGIMSVQVPL